jgi:hypothetical protein
MADKTKPFTEKDAMRLLEGAYAHPRRVHFTHPDYPKRRADNIRTTIADAAFMLLSCREDDEFLPEGEIEKAVRAGEITIEEMGEVFAHWLHVHMAPSLGN